MTKGWNEVVWNEVVWNEVVMERSGRNSLKFTRTGIDGADFRLSDVEY